MKMKKTLGLASLTVILLALIPFAAPTTASDCPDGPHCKTYIVMGGEVKAYSQLWAGPFPIGPPLFTPFVTRAPWSSPYVVFQDICFGEPVDLGGETPGSAPDGSPDIVPICVPGASYKGLDHTFWSATLNTFLRTIIFMPGGLNDPLGGALGVANGSGVIFLNGPGHALAGDVDVITETNYTAVYWGDNCGGASPLAGQYCAATAGNVYVPSVTARFPSPGSDGVPGTSKWNPNPILYQATNGAYVGPDLTDGFGDCTVDPKGSSILILPAFMYVLKYDPINDPPGDWDPLILAPSPQVLTTACAYNEINVPGLVPRLAGTEPLPLPLHGYNSCEVGAPWQYLSDCLPWDDPGANKKVTYASAWSTINFTFAVVDGAPYTIDLISDMWEKKVREDQAIPDITCDQRVTIADIVCVAHAFGSKDEQFGVKVADPNFDGRADLDGNSVINIFDLVRVAVKFGCQITPECLVCS